MSDHITKGRASYPEIPDRYIGGVDRYELERYFKGPLEFLTNIVPKIILGRKYRLFSNFNISEEEKNLIMVNIDTGIYDPTTGIREPWYIMHQDIDNLSNIPKYWIKMECTHKSKPELKTKAYFLFDLGYILESTYSFLRVPYRERYSDVGGFDYPYPITEYLERHCKIDINTPPYNDDDIVIDCVYHIQSYYPKYIHYKELRDKLIRLRGNISGNNSGNIKLFDIDEFDKFMVKHNDRQKWYVEETNKFLDKIYSVSGLLCGPLLGIVEDEKEERLATMCKTHSS